MEPTLMAWHEFAILILHYAVEETLPPKTQQDAVDFVTTMFRNS